MQKREVRELGVNLAKQFEDYKAGLVEETNKMIQEHNAEDLAFIEKLTHGIDDKINECVEYSL
eukprot:gnl/Chilomastix_caulleri/3346.p2 GENE.gnl/Chilomastix_caulleri/3346~~gnl/Chilomastix_caulleri/3346.p2  ORF type:complete len:63 (+),score=16.45 gnl/Chilomastix_caulleri/3346:158-346(+)